MEFKRITVPDQPYLFLERTVAMHEIGPAMAETIPALFTFCGQNGITPMSMPMSIYMGDPGPTMTFRTAVFVTAADAEKASGDISADTLPASDAVMATHVGGYEKLGASHQALWNHMDAEELKGGTVWEIYVDDPGETGFDACRTEIYRAIA